MAGGMSQPGHGRHEARVRVQRPVEPVKTNADGVQISQYLPDMAEHMDKVAVIRSMHYLAHISQMISRV
jgi:hypothetical protein